ncbi:MAG: NapC/NirT family cytochrome c [Thermoleophilia bacterium]|nr:NapC/NirT family cytochrome c [Thermoleophilia bacterium]
MYTVILLLAALVVIAVALLAGVSAGVKPGMTRRAFVFLALTVLPGLWTLGLLVRADATMKSVGFCLGCHEMEPFGSTLMASGANVLAASHYRNEFVDRGSACYECHSEDTIAGAIDAKLTGLHDIRVHYLGTIPDTIRLKEPYKSSICLSCHGATAVGEEPGHPHDLMATISAGDMSCLDCHGPAH